MASQNLYRICVIKTNWREIMALPEWVNRHNLHSFVATAFAAAANWYLSSEELSSHAILTSGICVSYFFDVCFRLYDLKETYEKEDEGITTTCGIHDGLIMSTYAPVLYASINVFLIAVFATSGQYEGNIDPSESKTSEWHGSLAILAIVVPYLVNTYFSIKYPLRSITDRESHTDECLKQNETDSKELFTLKSAARQTALNRRLDIRLNNFFQSTGLKAETQGEETEGFRITLERGLQVAQI